MANSFTRSSIDVSSSINVTGDTGAKQILDKKLKFDGRLSGAYVADNVLDLSDYSLTVAAGNLDIDLYDLASLDIGAGAGRDNLGASWAQAKVYTVVIGNSSTSAGTLRIDQNGAGSTAWTGLFGGNTVLDLPAGAFVAASLGTGGATVTDVTNHILRLSAQTDTCSINVTITSGT